jgi:hypothetical protein
MDQYGCADVSVAALHVLEVPLYDAATYDPVDASE